MITNETEADRMRKLSKVIENSTTIVDRPPSLPSLPEVGDRSLKAMQSIEAHIHSPQTSATEKKRLMIWLGRILFNG